jgi:site-specific DNA-methyltransferase (cytosine-N4-specific)
VEAHTFLHRDKWFGEHVVADLSRIRGAIQDVTDLDMRRFLWICLAETVRRVSNSRMSTFKLHAYDQRTLETRAPDALQTFELVGIGNARRAGQHWQAFEQLGEQPVPPTLLRADVFESFAAPKLADAVMTSPPYGDNHTTVPYGQHSYLPLQWMDIDDIPGTDSSSLLATPGTLDTASLGGSRAYSRELIEQVPRDVPSTTELFESLAGSPALEAKVSRFVDDYRRSLQTISDRLRVGGVSFFTLGERRVKGIELPLVAMTQEILESVGHIHVTTVTRRLQRKRMAGKNRSGVTMTTEYVLIMRKL